MAPVLNNFKPNNFQPRRKILNFINNKTKQTPVKRLEPAFHDTKVMEPNVQVSEPIVKPVAEPVVEKQISRELSKPIEPRRSKRVRKPKKIEIEEPTTQPTKKKKGS